MNENGGQVATGPPKEEENAYSTWIYTLESPSNTQSSAINTIPEATHNKRLGLAL